MKYVMAMTVVALVACGGPNRPPPQEPVSTTTTTSSVLTAGDFYGSSGAGSPEAQAPIIASKEADRNLGTKIRTHLSRDKYLESVPWRRVTMEINDAHVTLRGELMSAADSSEMERAVREVKGVHGVTNEIHVMQP